MPDDNTQASLLLIHAITSLHPGAGTASGAIDLPVQRERHTGWPVIPGSTLKGVLRERVRLGVRGNGTLKDADSNARVERLFGRSRDSASETDSSGVLSLTDGRLLLFPVRSLCGLFAYATCPEALRRFLRDAALCGFADLPARPELPAGERAALVADSSALRVPRRADTEPNMVLEEFDFTAKASLGLQKLADWLAARLGLEKELPPRIAMLSDTDFAYFAQHATEVTARIALDYDSKTVRDGALFYEEFVPPESVFCSMALGSPYSKDDPAADLAAYMPEGCVLQVGGNATIGKGLCRASLHRGGKAL